MRVGCASTRRHEAQGHSTEERVHQLYHAHFGQKHRCQNTSQVWVVKARASVGCTRVNVTPVTEGPCSDTLLNQSSCPGPGQTSTVTAPLVCGAEGGLVWLGTPSMHLAAEPSKCSHFLRCAAATLIARFAMAWLCYQRRRQWYWRGTQCYLVMVMVMSSRPCGLLCTHGVSSASWTRLLLQQPARGPAPCGATGMRWPGPLQTHTTRAQGGRSSMRIERLEW